MCAYIKLFTSLPNGCSQFYELNQKLTLLRMLIFGKKDPLHEIPKTDEQIYSITRGRLRFDFDPKNAKLIALMKKELESTIRDNYGINIKAEKLQEYFCYHFDDTGHNAHKRRPKEMSKILRVYVTVLCVIEKYRPLT